VTHDCSNRPPISMELIIAIYLHSYNVSTYMYHRSPEQTTNVANYLLSIIRISEFIELISTRQC